MIQSVEFKNFKVLRDTTLPLSRFTLLVGPNGSGKTTVLQGLLAASGRTSNLQAVMTAGVGRTEEMPVKITVDWAALNAHARTVTEYNAAGRVRTGPSYTDIQGGALPDRLILSVRASLKGVRVYSLDARAISAPVTLQPNMEMGPDGRDLPGVLDRLRDQHPERFEALNNELCRWIPEFDRILFDTPGKGQRGFSLRTREGHHKITASDLSQGTLLAFAMLTLAYLPDPPPIVGLEEPDRGIHPRLLRDVQDAMYRLAYPENFGEKRDPVQVIATTHSPYMLDLFKDHPEEIVIAQKTEDNVRFDRLSDLPHVEEILEGAHLGDVWYSGILGGVPTEK